LTASKEAFLSKCFAVNLSAAKHFFYILKKIEWECGLECECECGGKDITISPKKQNRQYMDSKDFRRLFDLFHYQRARYPQKNAIVQKEDHRWVPYSTVQCIRQSEKLAAGLLNLGLKKGDCCALIAPAGSTHWLFLDLALQKIGVVVVPIHATATWQDMLYILKDASIKYCLYLFSVTSWTCFLN